MSIQMEEMPGASYVGSYTELLCPFQAHHSPQSPPVHQAGSSPNLVIFFFFFNGSFITQV